MFLPRRALKMHRPRWAPSFLGREPRTPHATGRCVIGLGSLVDVQRDWAPGWAARAGAGPSSHCFAPRRSEIWTSSECPPGSWAFARNHGPWFLTGSLALGSVFTPFTVFHSLVRRGQRHRGTGRPHPTPFPSQRADRKRHFRDLTKGGLCNRTDELRS